MRIGVVDLFSGCGGTSLGLRQAGMVVLGGIDNDSDAAATYQLNFPGAQFIRADVRQLGVDLVLAEFRVDSVDRVILSACAPCQPFSKQRTTPRPKDDRVPLLRQLGRFVQGIQPDVVLIENVPGLQTFDDGEGPLADFLADLDEFGYEYEVRTIEARQYGVPQRRARLVVLASAYGAPGFPEPTHGPGAQPYSTVRDWIRDLPPIAAGDFHADVKNHRAHALSQKNLERIRATPEGGDRRDWASHLWLDCHSGTYDGHTDVYGRMSWDAPATGLTTRCVSYSNGRFGHPEQDRAISIREAACLQTFPAEFEFVGNMASMARQIGNAVPVLLAEALGRHLVGHLARRSTVSRGPILGRVA
ncbi:MAG TPA: DNA cytosine methyltransferase [Acidimicrobiia bacterium]|nr:DNA cytosine methyltransferase [Acidimicrobiia bacterium]